MVLLKQEMPFFIFVKNVLVIGPFWRGRDDQKHTISILSLIFHLDSFEWSIDILLQVLYVGQSTSSGKINVSS